MNFDALKQELVYWSAVVRDRPQDANAYVRRGMAHFKLAQVEESIHDFDQAERLEPHLTPHLWQRGLSFYYVDRFADGARQFETDLTVNRQDAEETLWRYLCIARLEGIAAASTTLLPASHDPRHYMRQIYDLFAGVCDAATLLSTSDRDGSKGQFYRHLYVGLYHEAQGNPDQAKEHILMAVHDYPLLNDYMWHLAWVHQQLRGWQLTP